MTNLDERSSSSSSNSSRTSGSSSQVKTAPKIAADASGHTSSRSSPLECDATQVDSTTAPEQSALEVIDVVESRPKYGPKEALKLIAPVSGCMLLVALHTRFVASHKRMMAQETYAPYVPFTEREEEGWSAVWKSLIIAIIFVSVVIGVTSLMVFAYFMKWYKAIMTMVVFNCFLLFSFMTFDELNSIVTVYNIPGDYVTLALFMYNFAAMGLISIFWIAPLVVQQIYLVLLSALTSVVLLHLFPSWAIWSILGMLAVWDLVAVLCPFGPLQILLKLARERDEPLMPALIYSSGLLYFPLADSSECSRRSSQRQSLMKAKQNRLSTSRQDSSSEHLPSVSSDSIRLGLGDFIFYGVLIGRAAISGEILATMAAFTSILIGLCATLTCLVVYRRALPALPISICLGIFFYFVTNFFMDPFCANLFIRHLII